MKLSKFEDRCAKAGLTIKGRADFDGIVAIVADGYSNGAAEMNQPHYRTIYAIGRDANNLSLMQSVYHKFGEDLGKSGMESARIQDAFETAKMVAESLKHGGLIKN